MWRDSNLVDASQRHGGEVVTRTLVVKLLARMVINASQGPNENSNLVSDTEHTLRKNGIHLRGEALDKNS